MREKPIIGVTVGTPISPAKMKQEIAPEIKEYIDTQVGDINSALLVILEIQKGLLEGGNDTPSDDDIPDSVGLEYSFAAYDNTYIVIGRGTCTDSTIKIPAEYEGHKVIRVSFNEYNSTWYNDKTLDTLILPDSGCHVDGYACPSLRIIKNVCSCDSFAFYRCDNLKLITFVDMVSVAGECELCVSDNSSDVVFDFTRNTVVPVLGNVDSCTLGTNPTIKVPMALLDEWKSATNWCKLAELGYIVGA